MLALSVVRHIRITVALIIDELLQYLLIPSIDALRQLTHLLATLAYHHLVLRLYHIRERQQLLWLLPGLPNDLAVK